MNESICRLGRNKECLLLNTSGIDKTFVILHTENLTEVNKCIARYAQTLEEEAFVPVE